MFKKFLAAVCCVALIFIVGCDNDVVYDNLSDYDNEISESENNDLLVNPLTGVADVSKEVASRRPVAIVVNNTTKAQGVQTGLNQADVIFESEVEGGITRLLAVYQDITDLDKVGTVRSARYHFVEIALGLDAVYCHCGQNTYAKNLLDQTDHLSIETNKFGGERIKNGTSAIEHTLYVNAAPLWSSISQKFDTKASCNKTFANFAPSDETVTLNGGTATSVKVPFPIKDTDFVYDGATGLYTRLSDGKQLKDYFTGEETQVKNVFILLTSKTYFEDNKTPRMILEGGDGYYVTNGTVQFIKWSKGNSTNGFKFTDTEGNEIKVSAGNSWVCIADKKTCNPTFE